MNLIGIYTSLVDTRQMYLGTGRQTNMYGCGTDMSSTTKFHFPNIQSSNALLQSVPQPIFNLKLQYNIVNHLLFVNRPINSYLSFHFQQSGHFLNVEVALGLLSHKQYLQILNLIFLLRSAVKPPAEPPLYRLCTIKISVEPEYTSWRCRRCRQEKLSTVFHSLIFPP